LSRLGGPNFHEIPINRPVAPIHNNQRDSKFRHQINQGRVAYEPNTLGGGCPFQAMAQDGGFTSFEEKIDARKIRVRSDSFRDHFTQAALFFNSQADYEKTHIVNALSFELGKVEINAIRERMVYILNQIDASLAAQVAAKLGIEIPAAIDLPINRSFPADADPADYESLPKKNTKLKKSAPLSMANTVKDTIKSRKIAILLADGFNAADVKAMKNAIEKEGAQAKIVALKSKGVKDADGKEILVDHALRTVASVLFDAVYIPGGAASADALSGEADAYEFVNEAFRHCKAIAATGAGVDFLNITFAGKADNDKAVITGSGAAGAAKDFIKAVAEHRNWAREAARKVPA
ncbi:MAG TPA: catalase-related domain-containing protein, partial [Pyrinomonadaceae bacterium]